MVAELVAEVVADKSVVAYPGVVYPADPSNQVCHPTERFSIVLPEMLLEMYHFLQLLQDCSKNCLNKPFVQEDDKHASMNCRKSTEDLFLTFIPINWATLYPNIENVTDIKA